MLVRNLLEKYPDGVYHMMTPGGYVDLAPEQVKGLLKGESVKAHPGASGYDMEMGAGELLNEKVHSVRWTEGGFYLVTDYVSGQEEQGEEPQGLREAEETVENDRKLRARLKANYEAYITELKEKPAGELIEMAPEIAAAGFMYKELSVEGAFGEYAGYLLQFENPLELLQDSWLDNENCDRHEEIGHMLWDMKDKGLGIGDYPMAEQAGEGAQGQGMSMC